MKTHYPALDWLRLFLALEVVYMHVTWHATTHTPPTLFNPVPCFLAISGFVIPASLARSTGVLQFWKKRALRILPALAVATFLTWLLMGLEAAKGTALTYLTGGIVPAPGDGVVWSLMWEEAAYGFLCVLWLCGKLESKAALWLIFAGGLVALWFHPLNGIFNMVAPLPASFAIGALWRAYEVKVPAWASLVPTCLLAVALAYMHLSPSFMGWYCGGPHQWYLWSSLIGCLSVLMIGTTWKAPKLKVDLSYGSYVYHWPLMMAGAIWVLPIACLVSYYLIERPALRLKQKKAAPMTEGSKIAEAFGA